MTRESRRILWPVAAFFCCLACFRPAFCGDDGGRMFDPAKYDIPGKDWCYYGKPTTVIGKPFVPGPVQITFDGAIYTGYSELSFFYGPRLVPVMARIKTFLEGWIPVVRYSWEEGGLRYGMEIFSDDLPGLGTANLVQFAKFSVENISDGPKTAVIAAAIRESGGDHRKGKPRFHLPPTAKMRMEDGAVMLGKSLGYAYSPGARRFVLAGTPYTAPYSWKDYGIIASTSNAYAVYERKLAPGESFSASFKIPRVPVSDPRLIREIKDADHGARRGAVVAYWKKLLGGVVIDIPEKRVNDSRLAGLVHLILATRGNNGKGERQGSGLPYNALFLNDYMDMMLAYERNGLPGFHMKNVEWLLKKQYKTGMFIDVHNRGNDDIVTSHGQALFALAYPYLLNRDRAYAERVFPAVSKAVELIIKDHESGKYHGLLRPSIPYDAPMVTGLHSCHNLMALAGMRAAIRMADMLGDGKKAARWRLEERSYAAAINAAFDDAVKRYGYITSGLYDWRPGRVQGRFGANKRPNQDWENNLLIYPSEFLTPDDPRVRLTLDTIRRRKYREGIMTYRNGMHLHQYITLNQAHQYLFIDKKKALLDLYHVLLHNGATHAGFENLVVPWGNRTPRANCPPPHAWAAAKTALFIRNMMVLEYGGDLGVRPGERDLYLYSLISPAWAEPGKRIELKNVPTEMGRVSSRADFRDGGVDISFSCDFNDAPPRNIVVPLPYFVELDSFKTDASESRLDKRLIRLSPDATFLKIKWRLVPGFDKDNFQNILEMYRSEYDLKASGYVETPGCWDPGNAGKPFLTPEEKARPPTPLSFALVRSAFEREYARRFGKFVRSGGKPWVIKAPPPGGRKSPGE